jgi:hypothetical protein
MRMRGARLEKAWHVSAVPRARGLLRARPHLIGVWGSLVLTWRALATVAPASERGLCFLRTSLTSTVYRIDSHEIALVSSRVVVLTEETDDSKHAVLG